MAKELLVSVAIGAVLQGSYMAVFGGAKRTLDTLGAQTAKLKQQHDQMGEAMQRAMGKLSGGTLAAINRDYEKLGRTLDTLRQKQEALAASMAKGVELKNSRQEHWAGMKESAAMAVAVGAPLLASVKQAAKFEAGLRDIAITGNLKAKEEIALGEAMRQAALTTNQSHEAIIRGVNTLVASGMNANEAGKLSALLGKAATATNAEMNDLAKMMFSLSETLGIQGEAQMKEALNRAAFGAKLGRFELKDMAGSLPTLAAQFAAKGIKGQEALTQIVASLEVGMGATGTPGEAVTNLTNWLSHMNANTTKAHFEKAGVAYEKLMAEHVAAGYNQYESSLMIAMKFIDDKGDAFMKKWEAAGAKGDKDAMRALMESFGLSSVFQDIQTVNHLIAMRQGWDKYQQNKKDMGGQQALGTIDDDYIKRAQTMQKAWERFTAQITDVAITVGNVFLPAVSDALDGLGPMVRGFGEWAKANPVVLRGIVGLVGGMIAMRTAVFGLRFLGNFLFLAPANSVATAWGVLSSRFTIFRALVAGGSSRFPLLLQFFGLGAERAAKLAGWFSKLGGWALSLGRTLAGGLLTGLRLATQAVFWLGRALLMNPIGLAITAIAGGAYLIYRNWDRLKPWFSRLWAGIRSLIGNAWEGIKGAFFSFHPLGILLKNWQPLTTWFRGLPAQFAAFGRDIINGLVNGIQALINKPVEAITSMGASIRDKFKSLLGIKSPSRVFAELGINLAEGAAAGVSSGRNLAVGAVAGMALATSAAWGKPELPAPHVGPLRPQAVAAALPALKQNVERVFGQDDAGQAPADLAQRVSQARAALPGAAAPAAAGGAMTIHFSPQITIQGGEGKAVQDQVGQAMQLSFAEFERMIRRYEADRRRRSYGES